MTLATSSSQLPYDEWSRENVTKYSASRIGRKRKRNVGSVNSTNREYEDVLAGQRLVDLRQREALVLDLELRFGHAHLVLGADRDRPIFLAVFQEHETAVGLQRLAEPLQHGLRPRELVVHV